MRILASAIAAFGLLLTAAGSMAEDDTTDPQAVVRAAIAAHGGALWLNPQTLVLRGKAEFYAPRQAGVVSRVEDYRMWRELNADRQQAHGAEGKVRIRAANGDRVIFEVGYDGATTWNQDGIVPEAEADAYWASNFGFGIMRQALTDGFTLERAPGRDIEGHLLDLVRIIDPQGNPTLFGIDRESRFIRYMAFRSPRGLHERIYDDFVRYPETGWVQAREVTLFYDGVKNNTVHWEAAEVGAPIDPAIFAPPRSTP